MKLLPISLILLISLTLLSCSKNEEVNKHKKIDTQTTKVTSYLAETTTVQKYSCKNNKQSGKFEYSTKSSSDIVSIKKMITNLDNNCVDKIEFIVSGTEQVGVKAEYISKIHIDDMNSQIAQSPAVLMLILTSASSINFETGKSLFEGKTTDLTKGAHTNGISLVADYEGTQEWVIGLNEKRKFEITVDKDKVVLTIS